MQPRLRFCLAASECSFHVAELMELDMTFKQKSGASQPLDVLSVPDALLKLTTVVSLTGLSESTIRRRIADGSFPKPIKRSVRCTRWISRDVATWLRDGGPTSVAKGLHCADGTASSLRCERDA